MTDHRITSVRIVNQSGMNFTSVSVLHKYSDNYKNDYTWHNVESGITTDANMTVDYHTGITTTGKDWWYVMAVTEDGKIYITDPSNATSLLDVIDKVLGNMSGQLVSPNGKASVPGAVAAAILTAVINQEGVSGFKQFILREEDEKRPVSITLTPSEVRFEAQSGTASTPLKARGSCVPVK